MEGGDPFFLFCLSPLGAIVNSSPTAHTYASSLDSTGAMCRFYFLHVVRAGPLDHDSGELVVVVPGRTGQTNAVDDGACCKCTMGRAASQPHARTRPRVGRSARA